MFGLSNKIATISIKNADKMKQCSSWEIDMKET